MRFLLDEHYPGWLAIQLTESGVEVAAVILRDDLRGVEDTTVLRVATEEQRVVVTEDVSTFSIAMAVPSTPRWCSATIAGSPARGPVLPV